MHLQGFIIICMIWHHIRVNLIVLNLQMNLAMAIDGALALTKVGIFVGGKSDKSSQIKKGYLKHRESY